MSIINDAIKKARKEFELKNKTLLSRITNRKEEKALSAPYKSSERRWTVVIVVSLTLIVSLLGSVILYRHISRSNTAYNRSRAAPKQDLSNTSSNVYQKRSFLTVGLDDVMELNGIVYGPKDKWAIINDKIVREGDYFLGNKLTFIAKDFVKIEKHNGKEIVLNLR